MANYVSIALRQKIAHRAKHRCEYCRYPEMFAVHPYEPDHILSRQHGGLTSAANLAFACYFCNRNKGPNVGSFDPLTGILTAFFNPRIHTWHEHFALQSAEILPLTPEARVTVKILRFNDTERIMERQQLLAFGLFE